MPPGLGEILADSGDLTLRRLRRASDWRRAHGGTIERALLATGAVAEDTLLDALAKVTGLPSVSRERLAAADRQVVDTLPAEARRRLRALPFDRRGDILHVAVVDPGNPVLETGLIASTGCDVRLHVTADPILEDVLGALEAAPPAPPSPPRSPGPPVAPAPTAAPAPSPANDRPAAVAGPPPLHAPRPREAAPHDPIARLARALLVDALDEGAQAVEIGPEGRGASLRTYAGGVARSVRPIPAAVLEPLFAWFLERSRPPGPFEEGGLVIERSRRRVRVKVSADGAGTAWLVLEPEPADPLASGESEICLHEGADGDVFCPACGAPL